MTTSPKSRRRDFLQGSLLAGAASAAASGLGISALAQPAARPSTPAPPLGPTEGAARRESGPVENQEGPQADHLHVNRPGSDFMVDLLRAADIPYVAAMPGSTFRGLQESIVTYGANRTPELITCVHEEISAAMCHGYAKVAGKPMACLVHSTVGLQHASMAVYNAWCDKVPAMILAANVLDETKRRPGVEWTHTMTDLASMVRDFVKFDDVPVSLQHYSESFMRAYEISLTPPCEPVMLVVDAALQEEPIADPAALSIPRRSPVAAPGGDPEAIERAAEMLVLAASPVIVADRAARTAKGMDLLVRLAELLNAPVIDRFGRLNIPTNHYLNHSFRARAVLDRADVVLALELQDIWGLVNDVPDLPGRASRRVVSPGTKVVGVSAGYAYLKSNVQDLERYLAADLAIAADAQTCLPQLIDAVTRRITPARRAAIDAKRSGLEMEFRRMRAAAAEEAALAWDASPIGTARLCMEIWDQIKMLDWGLVSSTAFVSSWPLRLWDITRHHQYIGQEGGFGVGYGAPAAAGAALAHRDAGRIAVAIQTDGDLMVLPGTLWTLAHHRIPLLMVLHNNRAWHQETMHLQRMAGWRDRGVDRARIGTTLEDPFIDYASVARGFGVWAEGPISDPNRLRSAIARALEVVKQGKPALLDVITQPR